MVQGAEIGMKRVVMLILALLLVFNLAEDGCLSKATFVAPHSSAKTSLISPLFECSGKVNSRYTQPSDGGEISRLLQFQPVTFMVQPTFKIIVCCNTGSSGGIPL